MRSGIVSVSVGAHNGLAQCYERALIEIERHHYGRRLATVHQHRGLPPVAGTRNDLAEDVAGLVSWCPVLGAGGGHVHRVADSLQTTTAQSRVLSYYSYVGVTRKAPP